MTNVSSGDIVVEKEEEELEEEELEEEAGRVWVSEEGLPSAQTKNLHPAAVFEQE
jgi:hypothetical protein